MIWRMKMTEQQAIEFCETIIDCKYCPIYIYDLEKRSKYEKEVEHVACFENLISHPDWREDD